MIVLVYNDVLKGSGEIDFVILSIFNEFEKMLCKFYLWVEIKGKRGRKVLVFFIEEMKRFIDIFLEVREEVGVM